MNNAVAILIAAFLGLSVKPAQGADNMFFSGTLREPPPCVVTGDGDAEIDVNFDQNIGIDNIDGVKNRLPVRYSVKCEPGGNGLDMLLTLRGTPTLYDAAALQTSTPGLGVRVLQQNKPLLINQPLPISENPPAIEVVLIKEQGATLKEGGFEATATLEVNYQ